MISLSPPGQRVAQASASSFEPTSITSTAFASGTVPGAAFS